MKLNLSCAVFISATLGMLLTSAVQAAISENPVLHNGASPQAIDPRGRVKISVTGSTPREQLYPLSGFGVVQDFTGFVNNQQNIIAFTDPNRADARIGFSGSTWVSDSGANLTNSSYQSSQGSSIRWTTTNSIAEANTATATIDFGKYVDGSFETGAFPSVSAVSFVLNSEYDRFESIDSIVTSYYAADGVTLLSTQTVASFLDGDDPRFYGVFFSYVATAGESIGKVVVDVNVVGIPEGGTRRQVIIGIDDLGYTAAIPEASHVTLSILGITVLGGLLMRRRRSR